MKYISVIGFDRSGTTYLGNLLGVIIKDSIYAGEIEEGVLKYLNNNIKICSCGKLYPDCEVWGQILPEVKPPMNIKKIAEGLVKYSGAKVVIDSSKDLEHLKKVSKEFGENHLIVYIKRNPKGVIASRMKMRKERVKRGTHPRPNVVKQYNLMMIYDSFSWAYRNYKMENYFKKGNCLKLNYDLLDEDKINSFIRKIEQNGIETGNSEIQNHIIWGANKTRLNFNVKFKPSDSWKTQLSIFQKSTVDFITFPLRLLYGYKFK